MKNGRERGSGVGIGNRISLGKPAGGLVLLLARCRELWAFIGRAMCGTCTYPDGTIRGGGVCRKKGSTEN